MALVSARGASRRSVSSRLWCSPDLLAQLEYLATQQLGLDAVISQTGLARQLLQHLAFVGIDVAARTMWAIECDGDALASAAAHRYGETRFSVLRRQARPSPLAAP